MITLKTELATHPLEYLFVRRVRLPLVESRDVCRYVPNRRAKATDHSGKRFGELLLLHRDWIYRSRADESRARYVCRCSCGTELSVRWDHIRSGATVSCGCVREAREDGSWRDRNPDRAGEPVPSRVMALRDADVAAVEARKGPPDRHTADEYRALAEAQANMVRSTPDDWIKAALVRIFSTE